MKEDKERQVDRHLDAPAEANTEKHIDFPDVEEKSSEEIVIDKIKPSDRQKQWKQGVKEGEQENKNS